MKRVGLLLLMVALHLVGYSQQVEFDKSKHDFGTIAEVDGLATVSFKYTNKSSTPFIINSVVTSCGCTTPVYKKEPLMPGKTAVLEVSYDPTDRPGYFSKDITIYSDSRKHSDVVTITGNVTPRPRTKAEEYPITIGQGLSLSTSEIAFPSLDRGSNYTQIIGTYNGSGSGYTISSTNKNSRAKVMISPAQLASEAVGEISYSLDLPDNAELGEFTDSVYLSVNGTRCSRPIRVTATIVPDFSKLTSAQRSSTPIIFLSSPFYHFSVVKEGKSLSKEFTISNRGTRDLIIEKIYGTSPLVGYQIPTTTIAPGEKVTLTVTLETKGQVGRVGEKVTIISNDPAMPAKDIRVAASVTK